jgi:hypothetical protein
MHVQLYELALPGIVMLPTIYMPASYMPVLWCLVMNIHLAAAAAAPALWCLQMGSWW